MKIFFINKQKKIYLFFEIPKNNISCYKYIVIIYKLIIKLIVLYFSTNF